ncbi:MAG: CPBP family intramembrane glutamic endopeptidase [Terracidiphilus sp.]
MEPTEIEPTQPTPLQPPVAPATIAPAWHTVVLVAGILAISIDGASRLSALHAPLDRLRTYGFTAAMDLALLAWVALGLRLNKTPLRSLLGSFSWDIRSIATDVGAAAVFWIVSLMTLGSLGIAWSGVEAALAHSPPPPHVDGHIANAPQSSQARQAGQAEQALAPHDSQLRTLRALVQLAPANGKEMAAWALLCVLVGIVEEIIFRGYLQRQFIGWARGSLPWGVAASAVVFGAAHAYQGARGMFLIAAFGALFSVLALYRRSLRAGIFAHVWNDLMAGFALALLRSRHII